MVHVNLTSSDFNLQNIPNLEQKVARLQELGFDKRTVLEALILTNGNEDEAAGILFGG